MSRLISQKTRKIEMGQDEWIEVKEALSYEEIQLVIGDFDRTKQADTFKIAMPLLETAILNWNLKDSDGNLCEFSKDKIKLLNLETITELIDTLSGYYFPSKKNLEPSAG